VFELNIVLEGVWIATENSLSLQRIVKDTVW